MSSPLASLLIGIPAGFINITAGAGNLLSFLTLTTVLGTPPLVAHASNQVATPASFVLALRKTRGHEASWPMGIAACAGITVGVLILAKTPAGLFADWAPYLVVLAALLLAIQPQRPRRAAHHTPLWLAGCGVYGGWWGAGVSSLLLFTLDSTRPPKTWVATKNAIALPMSAWQLVVLFAASQLMPGLINWTLAGALAAGMLIGGVAGTLVVDRLPNQQRVRNRVRWAAVGVSLAGAGWMLVPQVPASVWWTVLLMAIPIIPIPVSYYLWRHVRHLERHRDCGPAGPALSPTVNPEPKGASI